MKNRDEFPKIVIEPLRNRVNNRCSNSDCRVPTTGPTSNPGRVNSIGIAAHITAAASGGPRYEFSLNPEERKSISNAIWLCSNCSIKIDRDPVKYTVVVLRAWKDKAEQKAAEEIGKKLPDDDYVIQSLSAVMTGQSSGFLPNLLPNASKATSQSLEKLDPRFSIKTNHIDGLTNFEINAVQTVNAKLLIKNEYIDEFNDKFSKFREHGEKIVIDSKAIEFTGSLLLEKIFSQNGTVELRPNLIKNVIQKLWLKNPNTNEIFSFYDIHGNVVFGTSSMNFEGNACDHVISVNFRTNAPELKQYNTAFTFEVDFQKWDDKRICSLPYFDSIYEFFNKIRDGWLFHSSIEIDGIQISSGCIRDFDECDIFQQAHSQLHYISMVIGICRKLNSDLTYCLSYEYTSDEHHHIAEINKILSTGISLKGKSEIGNFKCKSVASEDLSEIIALVNAKNYPAPIYLKQQQELIKPFLQPLLIPQFTHFFSEVTPIIKSDISSIKPGDIVEMELIPSDNCVYEISPINFNKYNK